MDKITPDNDFYVIKKDVLPKVFSQVVEVKQLLNNGSFKNISSAVKAVGISRSAYYKYKDYVFPYEYSGGGKVLNLRAKLVDRAGVFSVLTAKLFEKGVNILTINQSLPENGVANVTLSVKTDNLTVPLEKLIKIIKDIDGVFSVKITEAIDRIIGG